MTLRIHDALHERLRLLWRIVIIAGRDLLLVLVEVERGY